MTFSPCKSWRRATLNMISYARPPIPGISSPNTSLTSSLSINGQFRCLLNARLRVLFPHPGNPLMTMSHIETLLSANAAFDLIVARPSQIAAVRAAVGTQDMPAQQTTLVRPDLLCSLVSIVCEPAPDLDGDLLAGDMPLWLIGVRYALLF